MKNYCINKQESSSFIKYYVDGGLNRSIVYYGDGTKKVSYEPKEKLNSIMESQVRKNEFNVLGDDKNTIQNRTLKKMLLMLMLAISAIPVIFINAISLSIIYGLLMSGLGISLYKDMKIISDYKKNVFYLENKNVFNKIDKNININSINNVKINELEQIKHSIYSNAYVKPKKLILKRSHNENR